LVRDRNRMSMMTGERAHAVCPYKYYDSGLESIICAIQIGVCENFIHKSHSHRKLTDESRDCLNCDLYDSCDWDMILWRIGLQGQIAVVGVLVRGLKLSLH
jgi:hypothetical protein